MAHGIGWPLLRRIARCGVGTGSVNVRANELRLCGNQPFHPDQVTDSASG